MIMSKKAARRLALGLLASGMVAMPVASQAQYEQRISNNLANCAPGKGPAIRVTITDIKSSTGKVRLHSYYAKKSDWLKKGRWLKRIDIPAKAGTMTFCIPVDAPGEYALGARHDKNGNDEDDITIDGAAMSNDPPINIFNLGKPSVKKATFTVGSGVTNVTMRMRYL
ncbi:DUF2141 domain-containing protein [Citromicrobium bathyomarinum]|uniref:DUF2141 domain-containing protein n=2 Tax=Citromicrobium TaxID=72173 RepID=UPI000312E93E|tara:strand:+ start:663 stop:1166 length:504 start_codon:yes stop_codon:yes gene_type:complete